MIRPLLTSVFLLGASSLFAAPAVPLVNLVDDQTLFAVSITDAPALLRGWDAGPLAKTWEDPEIVKFLAPLRAQIHVDQWDDETKSATGMTVREILNLAKGEALLAVPSFEFAVLEKDTPPPVLMALDVGDQGKKIEKILADFLAKKDMTEETETFSGVKVHTRDVEKKVAGETAGANDVKVSWAIVDGTWLISTTKDRIFKTIDAIKQGGVSASLGKSEKFLSTRQRTGDAQGLFYVNTPAIYPLVREGVAASKAKTAGKGNSLGLDPEAVLSALGLDALGEVYVAVQTSATETILTSGAIYSGDRGLLKLIAYEPGPAPRPDWIGAKWPSVSTAKFSLPKAYAALEELLEGVSPMFSSMAQGYVRQINKNIGLDLKRDFIGSFGTDIVSASVLPPGTADSPAEMDQIVSFSLVNEAAMVKSIEAFKRMAGPAADQLFAKREYLGYTIFSLNLPPAAVAAGQKGTSYAIADGTLLIGVGSNYAIESALQGMKAKAGLFWKRDDVKAAIADFPADISAIQVQDLRTIVTAAIQAMIELETSKDPSGENTNKMFDVSAKPDAEVIGRYWGLTAGYSLKTSEGMFNKMRIVHPQK